MRTPPPPGKKRVGDWRGLEVELVEEMSNGWAKLAAGTRCTVTGAGSGLDLETARCKCCGVRVRITRVHPRDVRIV